MLSSATATLQPLFDAYLADGDDMALRRYLAAESHLPGRRVNIELARAFAETAGAMAAASSATMWGLVERLTALSAMDAPQDTPAEFLSYCGGWAAGEVGASVPDLRESALTLLRALARDERWRIREAAASGIQALLRRDPAPILAVLDTWIVPGDWLAMRVVAAGLADPDILEARATAEAALDINRRILAQVRTTGERRSEDCPEGGVCLYGRVGRVARRRRDAHPAREPEEGGPPTSLPRASGRRGGPYGIAPHRRRLPSPHLMRRGLQRELASARSRPRPGV